MQVICKACNYCRDLDLCKDPHQGEAQGLPVWLCPNTACQTPYDTQVYRYTVSRGVDCSRV